MGGLAGVERGGGGRGEKRREGQIGGRVELVEGEGERSRGGKEGEWRFFGGERREERRGEEEKRSGGWWVKRERVAGVGFGVEKGVGREVGRKLVPQSVPAHGPEQKPAC